MGSWIFDLEAIFEKVNEQYFDGFLEAPVLVWNPRLRSSAGRFVPGSRKWISEVPPRIEVATYLQEETAAETLIVDTVAHEMIHYWLWVRRRPYGHTEEFLQKMRAMGVSRYNPVPRLREPKYLYRCPACEKDFPTRRRLGVLACLECCKRESGGKFDRRFRLMLVAQLR